MKFPSIYGWFNCICNSNNGLICGKKEYPGPPRPSRRAHGRRWATTAEHEPHCYLHSRRQTCGRILSPFGCTRHQEPKKMSSPPIAQITLADCKATRDSWLRGLTHARDRLMSEAGIRTWRSWPLLMPDAMWGLPEKLWDTGWQIEPRVQSTKWYLNSRTNSDLIRLSAN